jgi:hypothetical protein
MQSPKALLSQALNDSRSPCVDRISESSVQIQVIDWYRACYPKRLICFIQNGGPPKNAIYRYRMGELAGMPDLLIPEPIGRYHGMFLELKRPIGSKPTNAQNCVIKLLNLRSYYATVAYGKDDAINKIMEYFSGIAEQPSDKVTLDL